MKKFIAATAIIGFLVSSSFSGAFAERRETIGQLVNALSTAYAARSLGRLDGKNAINGKVKIIIEHSLAEDGSPNQFVSKSFTTFAKAEKWLRSREHDSLPSRSLKPLSGCKKGVCSFNFNGGILHNSLYIKRVTYGFSKGQPYIKTILLLDGD